MKERELLERIVTAWEDDRYELIDALYPLIDDARKLLELEKQDQPEPMAWMFLSGNKRRHYHTGKLQAERSARLYGDTAPVPLYLHPAPQRGFVRLSEEEIGEVMLNNGINNTLPRAIEDALEEKNK